MNEPGENQVQELNKRIGTSLLLMGAAMSILMFIDGSDLDIPALPGFWYRSRSLHLLLCIGFFLGGLFLLRDPTQATSLDGETLNPGGEGQPVFDSVRLFTRSDCPLCEEAIDTLELYGAWMPEIEFIDISGDSILEEQYGQCIPVIEIDSRIRFRGRVDSILLRRLIEAQRRTIDVSDQECSS
ncbi:MAG: glutaredoxin family protein [Fuerstiella sp.]|nr:glutaredoxin family protein [Fuerstiella sp.]